MTAGIHALAAVLALAGSPASTGAGIQPGPECLPTTAAAGSSYALPPVTVSDSGSDGVNVSLHVEKQPSGRGEHPMPGRPVPPSWVKFTYPRGWGGLVAEPSIHLDPGGKSKTVPARLTVPPSATPGPYVSWIVVGAPAGTAPGLNLGAAAATFFEITVTRAGVPARHAVCVSPGVKQASSAKPARRAAHAATHHPGHPAAKGHLVPRKLRKYVPAAIIAAIVLGAVAFLRRRRWL